MKVKALLSLLIIGVALLAVSTTGCKRRTQTYAGIEDPKASEKIEPNAQY